jgi:hypothetical protein
MQDRGGSCIPVIHATRTAEQADGYTGVTILERAEPTST